MAVFLFRVIPVVIVVVVVVVVVAGGESEFGDAASDRWIRRGTSTTSAHGK